MAEETEAFGRRPVMDEESFINGRMRRMAAEAGELFPFPRRVWLPAYRVSIPETKSRQHMFPRRFIGMTHRTEFLHGR
jgi:hypothetical protein